MIPSLFKTCNFSLKTHNSSVSFRQYVLLIIIFTESYIETHRNLLIPNSFWQKLSRNSQFGFLFQFQSIAFIKKSFDRNEHARYFQLHSVTPNPYFPAHAFGTNYFFLAAYVSQRHFQEPVHVVSIP